MTSDSARGEPVRRRLNLDYVLPGIARLRHYTPSSLRRDCVSGLVVSVLLVPQAVAYAQLAGLPPTSGLYAAMVPLLIYAMTGTRTSLSIGPVALVSILIADVVGRTELNLDATALATTLTLLIGAMLFLGGLLRLGFLVRFVSSPVIKGFAAGAAVLIALSQLGSVVGLELPRGQLLPTLQSLFEQRADIHWPTVVLSTTAGCAFVLGARWWPLVVQRLAGRGALSLLLAKSAPLIIIVTSMIATATMGLSDRYQVDMVGALDAGLPSLSLPSTDLVVIQALLLPAFTLAVIIFVIAGGIVNLLESSDGSGTPDRDAVALGATNIGAALSGGYAVGASFSRSAVVSQADAATPFTLAMTAAVVTGVALSAGDVFAYLPTGVLGALIITAVWSLIDVQTMRRIFRFSKAEAATLFLTTATVLVQGLQWGIVMGALAGIVLYLYGTSRPRITVEGYLKGSESLRSIRRQDVEQLADDDFLIVRVDESLYFGNARHVERCVGDFLAQRPDTRYLLLDLKSVDHIDFTALQMLETLIDALTEKDIDVRFVAVPQPLWHILTRFGIVERCGGSAAGYETAEAAVSALSA